MNEKIKFENVKKAADEVFKSTVVIGQGELNLWIETIRAITGKDVVEVVRCKDCVYGEPYDVAIDGWFECRYDGCGLAYEEDHFCSYGKRKDGAE